MSTLASQHRALQSFRCAQHRRVIFPARHCTTQRPKTPGRSLLYYSKGRANMGGESASQAALCGIEISKRPPKTFTQKVLGIISLVVFLFGCISVNATQLLFVVPLALLPFPWAKEAHESGVRYTKGAFGILISQLFGHCSPRKLIAP